MNRGCTETDGGARRGREGVVGRCVRAHGFVQVCVWHTLFSLHLKLGMDGLRQVARNWVA